MLKLVMKQFCDRGLTLFLTSSLLFSSIALVPNVAAERIKDLAMVEGARTNQLVGFGLVVGLDGTGIRLLRHLLLSKQQEACCSSLA